MQLATPKNIIPLDFITLRMLNTAPNHVSLTQSRDCGA
jgi:hypothetical protein